MKTGLLVAGALASFAIAQPHRHHQRMHEKRDDVVVTEVAVVYETTTPDFVVIVDQNGNPIGTSWNAEPTPAPAPGPVPQPAPQPAPAPVPSPDPSPAPAPAPSPEPAPAPQPSPEQHYPKPSHNNPPSGGGSGLGLTYSPYTSSGNCKSQDQVNADMNNISGFSKLRIYGVDCGQLQTVGSAVKAKGMKLMAGVYDINNVGGETQAIIDAFKNDWSFIDTVSVGNELVNSGKASADQVVQAINTARGMLRGAGFNGPVVTVDTFIATIANPVLCQNSDYAAVNAHSFFDGTILPAGAGAWAKATQAAVKAACGGKDTIITESGWPSQGTCNKIACPSPADQQTAVSSLKAAFPEGNDLFLFTAYNDYWKISDPATFNAEQFWGIYGNSAS